MSGGEPSDEGEHLTIEEYLEQVRVASEANGSRARAAAALAQADETLAAPRADTSGWNAACAAHAGPLDVDEHLHQRAAAEVRTATVVRSAAPAPLPTPAGGFASLRFVNDLAKIVAVALNRRDDDLIAIFKEDRAYVAKLERRIADLEEQATRP